jgi:flagellar motor switch protein FliG
MDLAKEGIRKAAILVASLEPAAADALLDHLGPQRARQLRDAMVALGEIDSQEQQRVIDEFFRSGPMLARKHPPAVELDGSLAEQLGFTAGKSPEPMSADARPFRFLEEAEADKLVRLLADERPQTIALVLSHLPPQQAGSVLGRLQPQQQVEVIRRLVDLEETDTEILREVEQALRARLSQQVCMQRRRVAGLQAVSGILEASEPQVAVRILDNLTAYDQPLAEKLSPPAPTFDDLARLDDAALWAVFQTAVPELVMTALVGAPPDLIERLLRRFSPAGAQRMRHKLNHPGPLRLSDVEDARRQIADLAHRLATTGRIRLPEPTEALFVA